jgi:ArsR family transcriptional regulator
MHHVSTLVNASGRLEVMVATAGNNLALIAGQCCPPLTSTPLSTAEAAQLAQVLKAVAEPTRLRLLSLLAAHEGGEACICELTAPVGLTQPTVSHHMKILVDAGLLTREQRGKWAYYRLVDGALDALASVLARPTRRPTKAAS